MAVKCSTVNILGRTPGSIGALARPLSKFPSGVLRAPLTRYAFYGIFLPWHGPLSSPISSRVGGTVFPRMSRSTSMPRCGCWRNWGPALGRLHADTVQGSRHANMKELRIQHAGRPYRVLFAFDPRRCAILLLGGDKTGNARWYDENIPVADKLFEGHLRTLERERTHGREGAKHDKEFQ